MVASKKRLRAEVTMHATNDSPSSKCEHRTHILLAEAQNTYTECERKIKDARIVTRCTQAYK